MKLFQLLVQCDVYLMSFNDLEKSVVLLAAGLFRSVRIYLNVFFLNKTKYIFYFIAKNENI